MLNRVLFIDDDELTLQLGGMMLNNLGYNDVVLAEGGKKALSILEIDTKFSVILLDLMMPDIYGLDVLRHLKSKKETRDIAVILQTGAENQSDINQALDLGVVMVLKKPYNKNTLKQALDSI